MTIEATEKFPCFVRKTIRLLKKAGKSHQIADAHKNFEHDKRLNSGLSLSIQGFFNSLNLSSLRSPSHPILRMLLFATLPMPTPQEIEADFEFCLSSSQPDRNEDSSEINESSDCWIAEQLEQNYGEASTIDAYAEESAYLHHP